jgi:Bacteriophage tail sheath protein
MPEYLAPGVYVEETSFCAKSIEGVSTTTTGFIGPTRYGPIDIEPDVIASLAEFERIYGGKEKLVFDGGESVIDNYMWHAVRAFFEEGGNQLYVSRTFSPNSTTPLSGYAVGALDSGSPSAFRLRARFPGEPGNGRVTFTLKVGPNILVQEGSVKQLRSLSDRDVVWIRDANDTSAPSVDAGGFFLALWDASNRTWRFAQFGDDLTTAQIELQANLDPAFGHEVRIVTLTVTFESLAPNTLPFVAADLPLDPQHERAGSPDSVFAYFDARPANLAWARTIPIVIEQISSTRTGVDILRDFFATHPAADPPSRLPSPPREQNLQSLTSVVVTLSDGNDGTRPTEVAYEGTADPSGAIKTGLKQFEDLEDISIVAAPGSTFGYENGYQTHAQSIASLMISHAERMRYRIAVLDSGDGQTISQVRAMRARYDSKYAALYYPWIRVLDPLSQREINVPPSGFVAGIYARNDINRGVHKAPANEVVNLAIDFEQLLNESQQDVLNAEGINCFRFFEKRGMRLWGARTISSDPEWKYVNVRRYFAYLEHSIDKGTQWAVFEPNGEQLWANVRRTIQDFLMNEWRSGGLLGDKPEKAYFVKCDCSTMSQNDLDNGRLICHIGVALSRPAEFVIFYIGQWTADRKV